MKVDFDPDLFPRAHEFGRLARCRASFLMSRKARELGQVAHTETLYSSNGTRMHEANLNEGEDLAPGERESWERLQQKRAAFIEAWALGEFESIKEERVIVRKGLRILATGQPDEVLLDGKRAAILDSKFGWQQVAEPRINWQLAAYALGVWQSYGVQEITVQLLSPYHDYEPFCYGHEELSKVAKSVDLICAELVDPPAPIAGDWCRYCQARLICQAAKAEAGQVMKLSLAELPVGDKAGRILHEIARAEELFEQIRKHYKSLLDKDPAAVPGWQLVSANRRWVTNVYRAYQRASDRVELAAFLEKCSLSLSNLEELVSGAAMPITEFSDVIGSKRTAPSLQATKKTK
jgi:CRISPR/Cas system-associated exonuclease Cas4 (RecB family)